MTVIVEFDKVTEWKKVETEMDTKTWDISSPWRRPPILKLRGWNKEDDVIYQIDIEPEIVTDNYDVIKVLTKGKRNISKVELDYKITPKVSRAVLVTEKSDGEKKFDFKHTSGIDNKYDPDEEHEKMKKQMEEYMDKNNFLEGKMNGSAKEVYVEVEY